MNILERRMFAQGDSVQSFSPAVIDYAQKLGIDPTGKSSNELQAEINLTLRAQTIQVAYSELTWLVREACFLILPIL